jgi:hypothetical protein
VADTGPPWNIPYAEPTDLVRDWPALSEDVAEAVADGLDDASLFKQIVQTIKTDTFTTTSATYTTVTGLTATITPSSATSKVLIVVQLTHSMHGAGTGYGHFRLSGGNATTYVGDANGSRIQGVFGGGAETTQTIATFSGSMIYVDSPASASPVTYEVQARTASNGAVFINRSSNDGNNAFNSRGASSITVIEVAA